MKPLLVFDINGTLIKRDERTDIPYAGAVDALLKTTDAMAGVDTSARSDKDVLMEVLKREGIPFTHELWSRFMALYVEQLKAFMETDIWRANADAVPFVKKLRAAGYTMILVSGELSIGAEYKLRKLDLWDCFLCGGFGEDGLKRFQIADAALKRAAEISGTVWETAYVIGDTVLDIRTARHLNARSIAITTGSHPREKLLKEGPDYCIDRFSEIEKLFLPVQ